ncbi:uncharacterized protein LOC102076969 isoform X2 [Oreochromis niloticus]|uniref:uncharacterized protein LOC102076969 isoform X2 n=1 Tax=Oreochromis niloticus TaxID=8128 RepID=UPI000904DF41|nr:uncharacterized protein LOC102076969 isoform X2 [Oreochromis niloticus]
MAKANAIKQRPRRCPWRKSPQCFSRRLFCCSCLRGEKDPLREQEKKINGAPLHAHSDQRGSGEKETIQITVEDLGIVNTNFSLFDEDSLTPRNSMSRSASSVYACSRALKKKRLKPLSSLPVQPQAEAAVTSSNGEDDEQEDEVAVLSGSKLDPENLLTPPVINLIPPTPSDFAEIDKFFEMNSEESVTHTSGIDGSAAACDQDTYEDKTKSVETEQPKKVCVLAESTANSEVEPERGLRDELGEQREAVPIKNKEKTKGELFRSTFQVAPLPELQEKRSFNTGINLLPFTEHNLDDLTNRDLSFSDILKRELCPLPHTTMMATFAHQRRPITRSCSLEDRLTRSATFHSFTQTTDRHHEEEGSPRQRRITVGDSDANLCGADMASVDVNTLDTLHISTLEDREKLLSAIYNELHPPSTVTQRIDSLLESLGPGDVETFTATLVSMTKSKSSPHVSCLSTNRRSFKLRNNSQNNAVQRSAQLIEITINASERIVHLRTPKETTVGKIMDSCIKMLGMTEDKSLFTLKDKQGSPEELSPDQQIGTLLPSSSSSSAAVSSQLELHLVKRDKPTASASRDSPEENSPDENHNINNDIRGKQLAKEERIRELNQQVDSLQNVIRQVQELHHGLVAFCSELKSMDGDANVDALGSAELKQRLELVNSRLHDKRQNLQTLRDNITDFTANKKKQLEIHLLEKMKLNCHVFKEEICIVHLNRQAAQLHSALQESYVKEKARKKTSPIGSLSQLVSPQRPAMLLVVQENQNPDGHYSFSCRYGEGSGLVVLEADNSQLCVDDRLVEVNGVSVVNSTNEELTDLLRQGPSIQVVVLRQPPPSLPSPPSLQHMVSSDLEQTCCPGGDVGSTETRPQRRVIAI